MCSMWPVFTNVLFIQIVACGNAARDEMMVMTTMKIMMVMEMTMRRLHDGQDDAARDQKVGRDVTRQ